MPAVPSIAAVSDIPYTDLTVAQIQLDASGSSPGSGASVTNWTWQLIYKPPGSAAAIADSGTDSQPFLQNIDKPGTYLVFLVVSNNIGKSSETNKFLAKDSAFVTIRAKTRYLDLKIPAGHERNWADIVYTNHVAFDNIMGNVSVWDTTHRLYFTTGNDAEIQDNRAAGTKASKWGLKVTSTTGINTGGPAAYSALHLDPTANAGNAGGGGGVTGAYINFVNQAIEVAKGEKVLKATLRTASSASHDGISISDTGGGWNLSYAKILTTSFRGRTVKVHHVDQTYPIAGVWAAAVAEGDALNTTQANMWLDGVSTSRLFFDLRLSSTGYLTAAPNNGLVTVASRVGAGAAATEQDFMFARVARHDDTGNSWIGDRGIGYSEGAAAGVAGTKGETWFIRSGAPASNGGQDRAIVSLLENRNGNIERVPRPLMVRGYEVVTASANALGLAHTTPLHADLFSSTSELDYTVYVSPVNASLSAATLKWGLDQRNCRITYTLDLPAQEITWRITWPEQNFSGTQVSAQNNVAAGAAGTAVDISFQNGGNDVAGITPYTGSDANFKKLVIHTDGFTGNTGGGCVNLTPQSLTMNNDFLSSMRVKVVNVDPSSVLNGNLDVYYNVEVRPYFHATDAIKFTYMVVCEGRY